MARRPYGKKELIFGFLKGVYRNHPKTFYKLFRENIAQGIERRHKLGDPVLEAEMLGLDQTLRALDVNLSKELKALNLPKERPRIVPPPASFQKMVDELGLHPVLQPECPKLFKDGLFQKCPLASSVPPAVASRRRKLPRPAGLRNWFLRGNGRASPRRSACLG